MIHYLPQRLATIVCLCGLLIAEQKSGVWLDVPFVKQQKDGCGAAVISMVMQYWTLQRAKQAPSGAAIADKAADAAAIQQELYSPQARGIYASAMQKYLKNHGYRTYAFAGTRDDLKQHLGKGRPLIVALKPAPGEKSLHYAVLVGLDWERKLVILNDPAEKKLLNVDQASFEKEWKAVGNWTLLALPE